MDFEFSVALEVEDGGKKKLNKGRSEDPNSNVVKFHWSEKDVGSLQSAYFIGYLGTEYAFKTFHDQIVSIIH